MALSRPKNNELTEHYFMFEVTHSQFETIKARFAKLRLELNKDKLTEFQSNLSFFADRAPYTPTGDVVTHNEFAHFAKEVSQALRATLINNNETTMYSRYKTNAPLGAIDHYPDCQSH